MKIEYEDIPVIEKVLELTLTESMKKHLLKEGAYHIGGRGSGRTLAYAILLTLSEGEPITNANFNEKYGEIPNNRVRNKYFLGIFLDIHNKLKEAGFPVREVIIDTRITM
jgi:hypothetical protein